MNKSSIDGEEYYSNPDVWSAGGVVMRNNRGNFKTWFYYIKYSRKG